MSIEKAREIINDAGMAFVATQDGNQPRVRPMMSILTDDNKILTSTFKQARKITQIKNNPKAELCFVDKKLNHCRIEGTISISEDKSKRKFLFGKQPILRQFFQSSDDPNFVLLEITPSRIEMMAIGERSYTALNL